MAMLALGADWQESRPAWQLDLQVASLAEQVAMLASGAPTHWSCCFSQESAVLRATLVWAGRSPVHAASWAEQVAMLASGAPTQESWAVSQLALQVASRAEQVAMLALGVLTHWSCWTSQVSEVLRTARGVAIVVAAKKAITEEMVNFILTDKKKSWLKNGDDVIQCCRLQSCVECVADMS